MAEYYGPGQVMPPLLETHEPPAQPFNYLHVLRLAQSGEIPAEFIRGRWRIREDNLPAVAVALGMRPKSPVSA
jgi:hypothetical protein